VSEVSSSCCIPLSGANRLGRKKEKEKEKEKENFLGNLLLSREKQMFFSQTVQQQIAVPERELM
jgi:hypothetical protein